MLKMEIQELSKDLFQGHVIRIFGTIEEPMFVANDLCDILGISKIANLLRDFDKSEIQLRTILETEGKREMELLTELGFCKVIFTLRKKEAVVFQKWVFEVLKKIRLNGCRNSTKSIASQIQNEQMNGLQEMEQQLNDSEREIEKLKQEYRPTVTYHNFDINDYADCPCIYLLSLTNTDYKFGLSGDIHTRFDSHMMNFKKFNIEPIPINIWKCSSMRAMHTIEANIKKFARHNHILVEKYGQKEIISTDNIDHVVEKITKYVDKERIQDDATTEIHKIEALNESKKLDIEHKKYEVEHKKYEVEFKKQETEAKKIDLEMLKIELELKKLTLNSQLIAASVEKSAEIPCINRGEINAQNVIMEITTNNITVNDNEAEVKIENMPAQKKTPKDVAIEWIIQNPPKEKTYTTDYYTEYTTANPENPIYTTKFGPLVTDAGFKTRSNKGKRYWVKK